MNTPVHPQIQRTLAAIVITDAVSFSKRMSQDEDKALSMINRDLQLISEMCEFFEGQVLKTIGDGVLMYFVSAVQAAACAVEMQKTFAGFVKAGKADEHFVHRVGVHLGDIFFTQTDMMGTGVNIAARLESEAKPGAICMSQVVYEVVKSRLALDAVYIGKLPLKNIEEAIAAYHVWPLGMRPDEISGESTAAVAPLTITPLNATLKLLSEHPNSCRIKKLLYGTHQAMWENDEAVLESIPLKVLLESLTGRNPTMTECRHSLYQIVGTLNRQAEYTQVADTILDSLKAFYVVTSGINRPPQNLPPTDHQQQESLVETLSDKSINGLNQKSANPIANDLADDLLPAPAVALYRDIADRLEQTPDLIRVKKMLYCLCYDTWENDDSRIAQIETLRLIETLLHQNVASIQDLQNRLRIILLRLNRKAKYAPIANIIFQECQVLYPEDTDHISLPGTSELEDSTADNTQINLRKKPDRQPDKQPDKPWSAAQPAVGQTANASVLIRSAAFGK
ncbi:MAG: hypothetical protein DCF15_18705 [Phormidesmis priestleyi]|uniref:Guanylate cyclase domain-containing protein n=1 Tax=Phormidesmis priestleyi TaxID=268141 RepID=A0A2W4WRA9_9CYAN|nr:MAG: hypothetical protein DCF15_18705 [Phormidesmis priestleyi]